MVLRLTCRLASVQAKMLMGSKSSPVSLGTPLCACETEFPQSPSVGISAVIQVMYGHGSCSTSAVCCWCLIVGFVCGLAVFWAILGAETSDNLFSSIGLFIWRNIQPKSVLILLM